jgi:putative FmdB family regulatory protein
MIYEYECNDCKEHFDITQRMSDPVITICPKCNSTNFHKIITVPMYVAVRLGKSDIKTLGHLAHRNTEEMDKMGTLPKENEQKKLDKKINKMTKEQQKTYIDTGIVP